MKRLHVIAAVFSATFCMGASAQNLKPGLWEITNKMKSSGGEMEKMQAQMQEKLAKMPSGERKKMEEMMAQHGVKMGAGSAGGMTAQTCMTKEMSERNEIPTHGDCKMTKQQRSGNTTSFAFSCTNPPSSGEGQHTFVSPEAYTFKMTMTTSVHGKPETMTMDGSGKWLAADCGSLKPMRPPGK
jgi:leucyl aminopeptidase (aminopeptidase T)